MCFSATASFVSGGLVSAVGVATLFETRHPRQILFASLPLLFGLHQLEEGVAWLALEGEIAPAAGTAAKWAYIIFAHALLPTLSPLSILLIERSRWRARVLMAFLALGLAISAYTIWMLFQYPIEYEIFNHSIVYYDGITGSGFFSTLYAIATCGPLFFSGYRWIVVFGVLNLLALAFTALVKQLAFTSVWCAFAAVASVFILLHFHYVMRHEDYSAPSSMSAAGC